MQLWHCTKSREFFVGEFFFSCMVCNGAEYCNRNESVFAQLYWSVHREMLCRFSFSSGIALFLITFTALGLFQQNRLVRSAWCKLLISSMWFLDHVWFLRTSWPLSAWCCFARLVFQTSCLTLTTVSLFSLKPVGKSVKIGFQSYKITRRLAIVIIFMVLQILLLALQFPPLHSSYFKILFDAWDYGLELQIYRETHVSQSPQGFSMINEYSSCLFMFRVGQYCATLIFPFVLISVNLLTAQHARWRQSAAAEGNMQNKIIVVRQFKRKTTVSILLLFLIAFRFVFLFFPGSNVSIFLNLYFCALCGWSFFIPMHFQIIKQTLQKGFGAVWKPSKQNKWIRFSRNEVSLQCKIGEGHYGQAWIANLMLPATEIVRQNLCASVVVKKLRERHTNQELLSFGNEALIMTRLSHPNVVKLVGMCMAEEPKWLVLEYLDGGTLDTYLRVDKVREMYCAGDLHCMALGVLRGCTYLHEQGYIHGDLAARNCLVQLCQAVDLKFQSIKICDFGHARDFATASSPSVITNRSLPVRWTAPEVFSNQYSTKSDIWSFGVLIWEIFTWGAVPFGECFAAHDGNSSCSVQVYSNTMVESTVCQLRKTVFDVPQPCTSNVSPFLEDKLKSCVFQFDPDDRKSFKQLLKLFSRSKKSITMQNKPVSCLSGSAATLVENTRWTAPDATGHSVTHLERAYLNPAALNLPEDFQESDGNGEGEITTLRYEVGESEFSNPSSLLRCSHSQTTMNSSQIETVVECHVDRDGNPMMASSQMVAAECEIQQERQDPYMLQIRGESTSQSTLPQNVRLEINASDESLAAVKPGIDGKLALAWMGDRTAEDLAPLVEACFEAYKHARGVPELDRHKIVLSKQRASLDYLLEQCCAQDVSKSHIGIITLEHPVLGMSLMKLMHWQDGYLEDLERLITKLRVIHPALGIILVGMSPIEKDDGTQYSSMELESADFSYINTVFRKIDSGMIGVASRHKDMRFISWYELTKNLNTEEDSNCNSAETEEVVAQKIFEAIIDMCEKRIMSCGKALFGPIPDDPAHRDIYQEAYLALHEADIQKSISATESQFVMEESYP